MIFILYWRMLMIVNLRNKQLMLFGIKKRIQQQLQLMKINCIYLKISSTLPILKSNCLIRTRHLQEEIQNRPNKNRKHQQLRFQNNKDSQLNQFLSLAWVNYNVVLLQDFKEQQCFLSMNQTPLIKRQFIEVQFFLFIYFLLNTDCLLGGFKIKYLQSRYNIKFILKMVCCENLELRFCLTNNKKNPK